MNTFKPSVLAYSQPVSIKQIARVSFLLILTLVIFGLFAGTAAKAEKRVALVVGNSTYRNIAPLDNPRNDARLMADTLSGIGFTLVGGRAQIDLDKASFDSATAFRFAARTIWFR
jgi:hypothetical protein